MLTEEYLCKSVKSMGDLNLMLVSEALAVPVEEFLDAFGDFYFVGPAEAVELVDRDEFAHGAVGLGGVELYGSFEAYGFDDELGEFTNGQLLARADVDVAVTDFTKGGDSAATTF